MTDAPSDPAAAGGRTRRDYLKWLLVAAVGIPVAVESRTLIGMVSAALSGGSGDALAVGAELLPSTAPAERVTELGVRTVDGRRRFRLVADVSNGGRDAYEVGITAVYLDDGTTLEEPASVVVPAGGRRQLRGEWALDGRDPTAVDVVGERHGSGGTTVVGARRAELPAFEP